MLLIYSIQKEKKVDRKWSPKNASRVHLSEAVHLRKIEIKQVSGVEYISDHMERLTAWTSVMTETLQKVFKVDLSCKSGKWCKE